MLFPFFSKTTLDRFTLRKLLFLILHKGTWGYLLQNISTSLQLCLSLSAYLPLSSFVLFLLSVSFLYSRWRSCEVLQVSYHQLSQTTRPLVLSSLNSVFQHPYHQIYLVLSWHSQLTPNCKWLFLVPLYWDTTINAGMVHILCPSSAFLSFSLFLGTPIHIRDFNCHLSSNDSQIQI